MSTDKIVDHLPLEPLEPRCAESSVAFLLQLSGCQPLAALLPAKISLVNCHLNHLSQDVHQEDLDSTKRNRRVFPEGGAAVTRLDLCVFFSEKKLLRQRILVFFLWEV